MAKFIKLDSFKDIRGNLTVLEKNIPFDIKRVFYIYNLNDSSRGGHRHLRTIQAIMCVKGSCSIYNNNSVVEEIFELDSPDKCLLLKPEDWHIMYRFSSDALLLVVASEFYDEKDYVYEEYPNSIRKP